MAVMIGVDPHKGSHTAVAIDQTEKVLGELRVRSSADQADRLVSWAEQWPARIRAVEGAGGLGYLLAQQLVAAGEIVLDVQPKLGARVRLLATGNSNKNDPNDARSVAIAALRSKGPRRHPKKEITVAQAARALGSAVPMGAVALARYELGMKFLDDLRRPDAQMPDTKKRLETAVKASGTTVTEVFGVGPYVAGTVIGYVGDASRFSDRDHSAAYNGTAPIEVSSGNHKIFRLSRRGNRRLNHAIHMAAVTQVRFRHSDGRAYYDRKVKEGKTHKEALRCLKRRISDAIFARLVADARRKAEAAKAGPGGQVWNGSVAGVASSHPDHRLFGEATPRPAPTIGAEPTPAHGMARERVEKKSRKAS